MSEPGATSRGSAWAYAAIIGTGALVWFVVLAPPFAADPARPFTWIGSRAVDRTAAYLTPWALGVCLAGALGIGVLRRRDALSPDAFGALVLGFGAFVFGAKLQYQLEGLPLLAAIRFTPTFLFDGGMRLPLGLLLGGVVTCAAAAVLGARWRSVGDAWAIGGGAMIAVGRLGCFLAGCCAGTACGAWAPRLLCLRYPPGTEVFAEQVMMGLIGPSSPASLPIHPLPLYFAAASLITTFGLVALLRRGARPGAVLLAFCIVRPLTKLALEPLRADPRPGLSMVAIPAVVLAGACLIAAVLAFRARARPPAHALPAGVV
jgi:prolipoprotein diacylglyceryltransferase